MSKIVFVTGAGGYLGHLLIEKLLPQLSASTALIAHDLKATPESARKEGVHYLQGDIRSDDFDRYFKEYQVDTVVHLASVMASSKNSNHQLEYEVDVLGTENILKACVKNQVKQFIITSSGAAYGYHADNPEWLTETDAIRGNEEFAYSYHKRLIEEMLTRYRNDYPALKQLIFRPGTILGATTNNQITDLFKKNFVLGISGSQIPFVFIWDMDVAAIIEKGILEQQSGIYNLAGDGFMTMKQIAVKLHKPYINMPPVLLKTALAVLHKIGLSQYGPNQLNFLRYRPVLSNQRLKEDFGYTPKYSSAQVFDLYCRENKM